MMGRRLLAGVLLVLVAGFSLVACGHARHLVFVPDSQIRAACGPVGVDHAIKTIRNGGITRAQVFCRNGRVVVLNAHWV